MGSLVALGLHFVLKRLTERRLRVEEQNRRLEVLQRELAHRERLSAIGKMSSVVSGFGSSSSSASSACTPT